MVSWWLRWQKKCACNAGNLCSAPQVWKDALEKEMATHSSILAWRIPWTEATVHGVAESDMTEQLTLSHFDYSDKKYTCSLCLSVVIMFSRASLIAQLVKNPPAMWETWIQYLA